MLATSSYITPPAQPHNFLPDIPSPLSPRRAYGRNFSAPWSFHPMTSHSSQQQQQQATTQPSSASSSHTPFSSRAVKVAPVPRSDALRERRRDIFLRKVRQNREDAKWDSRIDDMARLDYLKEKRQWEAEQARSAPTTYSDLFDAEEETEEYELPGYSSQMSWSQSQVPQDEREVDVVAKQEDEELEALVAMMQEEDEKKLGRRQFDSPSSSFGSDDDEYDDIFMNIIDEYGGGGEGGAEADQQQQHPEDVDDVMDLS